MHSLCFFPFIPICIIKANNKRKTRRIATSSSEDEKKSDAVAYHNRDTRSMDSLPLSLAKRMTNIAMRILGMRNEFYNNMRIALSITI